jgi:excisionase family DNA binding protein
MTAQITERDELMTMDQAAAFLQVPKSWLYERTRTGAIPVMKLGRHLRFCARQLAEWAEQQRVTR